MNKKDKRDFLTLKDYDSETIEYLLDLAGNIKSHPSISHKRTQRTQRTQCTHRSLC